MNRRRMLLSYDHIGCYMYPPSFNAHISHIVRVKARVDGLVYKQMRTLSTAVYYELVKSLPDPEVPTYMENTCCVDFRGCVRLRYYTTITSK